MTADLSALIARLEAAEEVTRDLAVEFAAFMYADPEAFKGAVNYDPELWVERNQSPLCSLDAALALAARVHGEAYTLDLLQDVVALNDADSLSILDLPRLLCAATLRAKLDGYEAEGEVNKNPKAQEG